jgi:putative DNA primase/helicase
VTIPEEEKDPQLADKLRAELPGILNWALEGLAAWQREGLGVPVAVETATAGYRAESDWMAAFINEECIVAPGVEVSRKELYEAYQRWAASRGEFAESAQTFYARLDSFDPRRITQTKYNGERLWRGIELRVAKSVPEDAEETVP